VSEVKCPFCNSTLEDEGQLSKHIKKIHLGSVYNVGKDKVTVWCEECDAVFDELSAANLHHDQKRHKIKVIEFSLWEGYR